MAEKLPVELRDEAGKPTGRWIMAALPDFGGGESRIFDKSHDHGSAEEAHKCERCAEYIAGMTGQPSDRQVRDAKTEYDRKTFPRLKEQLG